MSGVDPATLIDRVAGGYVDSRCLHTVVELGLADRIGSSPEPIRQLADAVGCDESALRRVTRHLVSRGIFTLEDDAVSHNDASRLLRRDDPDSLLAIVRLVGLPVLWRSFAELETSVRTGRPGVESVDPEGFFSYLSSHPEELSVYDAGMSAMTSWQVDDVVAAYDFSRFRTIADIAGGRGHLLQAVLRHTPTATGMLFERSEVLQHVNARERMTLHPGDFFHDPLPTADCYVLKSIIHDWDDDEALAILSAVRAAASPGATLLLLEHVVPDDNAAFRASDVDVYMLALVTGRERTRAEYADLLRSSHFELVAVTSTPSLSIIEARATEPASKPIDAITPRPS